MHHDPYIGLWLKTHRAEKSMRKAMRPHGRVERDCHPQKTRGAAVAPSRAQAAAAAAQAAPNTKAALAQTAHHGASFATAR